MYDSIKIGGQYLVCSLSDGDKWYIISTFGNEQEVRITKNNLGKSTIWSNKYLGTDSKKMIMDIICKKLS